MAMPRPMRHIEREDLYTNLEARIQYLHSFLDFSAGTPPSPSIGSKCITFMLRGVEC